MGVVNVVRGRKSGGGSSEQAIQQAASWKVAARDYIYIICT